MRVDIHTHAFADAIVDRAMTGLKAALPSDYPCENGRLGTLVEQLAENHFDVAVICSIATKPSQFEPIYNWSDAIRKGDLGEDVARRIVPFLSVHPEDPDRYKHIEQAAEAGFKGLKIHPYYQQFTLDSPVAVDMLNCAQQNDLIVVSHIGFDIAFPRDRICDALRVRRLLDVLPDLKLVVSHFGGWMDWDESERLLIGQPIDIEVSMTLDSLPASRLRNMLLRHPQDRLYFGSDWPWSRHDKQLALLNAMALPPERLQAILGGNAARLLSLTPCSASR